MADMTAYEMVTSRISNYANEAVSKYQAVAIDTNGNYCVATGTTKPFVGICQYGEEAAGRVITVVRGIFPGIASAAINAGDPVVPTTDGKFVKATSGAVIGVAMSKAAKAGELFGVQILDTPFTIASSTSGGSGGSTGS